MAKKIDMIIDMSPDGKFIAPPAPSLGTIAARVAAFGIGLLVLAVAFWTALFMLPILFILGVVGYFAFRAKLRTNGGRFEIRRHL
jgi:hypothetical protein